MFKVSKWKCRRQFLMMIAQCMILSQCWFDHNGVTNFREYWIWWFLFASPNHHHISLQSRGHCPTCTSPNGNWATHLFRTIKLVGINRRCQTAVPSVGWVWSSLERRLNFYFTEKVGGSAQYIRFVITAPSANFDRQVGLYLEEGATILWT